MIGSTFDLIPAFRDREQVFSLTGTGQQILQADPTRVAILFSVVGVTDSAWVLPNRLVSGNGLRVNAGDQPVSISFQLHGYITTLPWQAASTGVATDLLVVEVMFRPRPRFTAEDV